MSFKNINLPKGTIAMLIALGAITATEQGCTSRDNTAATELQKEIAAAKTSLDSISALYNAAAAKREMYQHKCDSLCPVVGVYEVPAERARKVAQWCQYRDSVSKYREQAIDLEIAKDWAQLNVDTLMLNQKVINLKSR